MNCLLSIQQHYKENPSLLRTVLSPLSEYHLVGGGTGTSSQFRITMFNEQYKADHPIILASEYSQSLIRILSYDERLSIVNMTDAELIAPDRLRIVENFCSGWGANIGIMQHPLYQDMIQQYSLLGANPGTIHPYEIIAIQTLLGQFPSLSGGILCESGSKAVEYAIRIARNHHNNSKRKILKISESYHGTADSVLSTDSTDSIAPIGGGLSNEYTQIIHCQPNDVTQFSTIINDHSNDISCIIIEGTPANSGLLEWDKFFLDNIQKECKKHNIVFIVDEVISCYRLPGGSACSYYGLEPDIVCLGKAITGGLPGGAVLRNDAMETAGVPGVYIAGTHNGNPLISESIITTQKILQGYDQQSQHNALQSIGKELNNYRKVQGSPLRMYTTGGLWSLGIGSDSTPMSLTHRDSLFKVLYPKLFNYLLQEGYMLTLSPDDVNFCNPTSMLHNKIDKNIFIQVMKLLPNYVQL